MSETARIREAARALHRLRPEDNRVGTMLAASRPTTAIEMAAKYRELAQRAAQDLNRRVRGLEGLFGGEVAGPVEAAAEELRELFYAALDQHELARDTVDRYVRDLRTQHAAALADARANRRELLDLLCDAIDDHEERQHHTAASRRKPTPQWVEAGKNLDDRSPF